MRNILLFSKAITLLLITANVHTFANADKQNQDRGTKRVSWRSAISAPSPSARVLNGTYIGVHSASYKQDFFLGIPYAQPPIDDLRFRIPQSLNSSFNGTKPANAYSPECVGYGGDDIGYLQSEDCLTLNVVRPAGFENESLPVAIWFHGGGNYQGGSADERYNLSFIVQNSVSIGKPFIGVSANYRLSAWGFLFSEQVADSGNTNLGLRDQRLALQWLQENIALFGGDPSKVTIWGESAGALDVGQHLIAYGGRDDKLFRAAIMESGNPVDYKSINGIDFYQPLYDDIVEQAGCSNQTDTLQCLRLVPFEQLNSVLNTTAFDQSFNPVVDGDFIQKFGSTQLAEGAFVHVPIISGANTDEGTMLGANGFNSDAEFLSFLEDTPQATGLQLSPSLAQQILSAYPNPTGVGQDGIPAEVPSVPAIPFGTQYRRVAAYTGDAIFIANRRLTCQTWAAHAVPAYCYRFNAIPAGVPYTSGVTHFSEVAFVFFNTAGYGYNAAHGSVPPFERKPQSFLELARLMASSWASFIGVLDPNGFRAANGDVSGSTGVWPVYGGDAMDYVFDANVSSYAEPDTFRTEGIALINNASLAYHR